MDYQLTLTIPGRPPATRAITTDTPAGLAQAVHRHARGILGHQVDVHLDHGTLTGTVRAHGAHAADIALTAIDTPTPPEPELLHGYTLADLHRLARLAVLRVRLLHAAAWHDYYDEALSAIFTHLVGADDPPHDSDLLHAADRAITDLVRGYRSDRGYRDTDGRGGVKWHPRFFRYWFHDPAGDDFAERAAERIAVHQILATLPPGQRDAVVALAECGRYDTAAQALEISPACLKERLRQARHAFLRRWYAPEAPAPRWRQDRRRPTNPPKDVCGNGHEYTLETSGYRSAGARRGERYCKACSREASARSHARRKAAAA